MKNYVQAYIAAISYPDSLDELMFFVKENIYTDIEWIVVSDESDFTAPRWVSKNDIVFFYFTKTAIRRINKLEKEIINSNIEEREIALDYIKTNSKEVIYKDNVYQNIVVVIDTRNIYIYEEGEIIKVMDLDELKTSYDIRLLKQKFIKLLGGC